MNVGMLMVLSSREFPYIAWGMGMGMGVVQR